MPYWNFIKKERVVLAGIWVTLGVICLGWLGLAFHLPGLASWGVLLLPMSPSTIVLFGLALSSLAFYHWPCVGPWGGRGALGLATLLVVFSIAITCRSFFGTDFGVEAFLEVCILGPHSGMYSHMSFLSALNFMLLGIALLFWFLPWREPRAPHWWANAAAWLTMACTGITLTATLAYLLGLALLERAHVISISLPAMFGFVTLSGAFLVHIGSRAWVIRQFTEPTLQARLLRRFIPLTMIPIFLESWLFSIPYYPHKNRALVDGSLGVLIAIMTFVVVLFITRWVGEDVNRSEQVLKENQTQLKNELEINQAFAKISGALLNPDIDIQTISDILFKAARQLTQSAHGYVAVVEPLSGDLLAYALNILGQEATVPRMTPVVFSKQKPGAYHGVWGQMFAGRSPFFTNTPESLSSVQAMPEGHIVLRNFLSVPVYFNHEMIGQIALANSDRAYTEKDLSLIQHLGELFALTILRERDEEALRSSEKELKTIFTILPNGISVLDRDGRMVFCNPMLEKILGITLEGFLQGQYAERSYVRGDGIPMSPEEFPSARVRRENRPVLNVEIGVVKEPGDIIWTTVSAVPIAEGRVLVATTDITARKQAEMLLKRVADELRMKDQAVATSLNGIAFFDLQGECTYANATFLKLMDFIRLDDAVGKNLCEMIPAGFQGRESFGEFSRRNLERTLEFLVERKDGSHFYLQSTLTLVTNAQERPLCYSGIFLDVSERKRLEKEVLEIGEHEQQRIGRDLHDGLGQELTGIALLQKGMAQRLKLVYPPFYEDAEKITDLISHAIGQLNTIMRGVFPTQFALAGLDVNLKKMADTIQERHGLMCLYVPTQENIITDVSVAMQLFYIAKEAVNNAVKHAQASQVVIHLEKNTAHVVLRIQDDGVGSATPEAAFPGLGLHIMKYRCTLLGGVFQVLPVTPHGTQITCSLPIQKLKRI